MRLSGDGGFRGGAGTAPDGYDSLVVMGMLDREYQARVALGLEGG